MEYIALHHEQSVSMAAEAYTRISGKLGVCQVTTGPGGTNSITGCAGAWIDSEPILFISGQVESYSLANQGNRQTGVQEINIINIVKNITKDAVILSDPYKILYELDRLIYLAFSGRKGPVWIDIPLNLQNFHFQNTKRLERFESPKKDNRENELLSVKTRKIIKLLCKSKKPVLCIGNGARFAIKELQEIAKHCSIPIILGWNGKDLIDNEDFLYIGTAGQFGNRIANLILSESDLIIGVGYRFSIPQIGYNPALFCPNATIVSVDNDPAELNKYHNFIDFTVEADAQIFAKNIRSKIIKDKLDFREWLKKINYLKKINFDKGPRSKEIINSFDFTDFLSKKIDSKTTFVTDMGTSFTCTHQHLKIKNKNRLITSSGLAAMGFGLPGAIGAYFGDKKAQLVLITGDGGLMFNIQELQSIVTLKIPIKIIIYENQGYLTMKLMQKGRFQRYVCSDPSSKIECPNFLKVTQAFGIQSKSIIKHSEIEEGLNWLFAIKNPAALIVHIDPEQELTPRVQTQSNNNGQLFPGTLDNMYPFLEIKLKKQIKQYLNNE
jgi:acetolactate synthase-1/2/3 large subunit